jgi:3-deoxy-D-manno-octulosonate 8-phosphate phosphatase (KDO 8-P phosphatase)
MQPSTPQLRAAKRVRDRLETLEAIAFDVDGVLTDGTLTWSPTGEEYKTFAFADIMGISLLRRVGLRLALISGEDTPHIDRYAQKMRIPFLVKGTRDKAAAVRQLGLQFNIPLENICFFGDDINDLFAMELCGLCACPANAANDVLDYVAEHGFVASKPGGKGAVREFADALLTARQLKARDVFLLRPPE